MFLFSFNFDRYRAEFDSGTPRATNPFVAFVSIFMPLDIFTALFSGFEPAEKTVSES